MEGNNGGGGRGRVIPWRMAAWATAALLLLTPLLAMQFTDEVDWGVADFAFAGILILATGGAYELTARTTGNRSYRAAAAIALATAFILIWVNLAVGIIGSEDNPANLMYGAVLGVGIIGAALARLRPHGMAGAMAATAIAQALVAVIAQIAGTPVWTLTGCFVALWLLSAWLFRKSARELPPAKLSP